MIYSRLAPSEDYSSSTNSHLKTFAVNGLRTLCVAERTIGLVDYEVPFNLSVCLCVWCVCVCACVCLSLPPPLLSNLHVYNGVNGGVITSRSIHSTTAPEDPSKPHVPRVHATSAVNSTRTLHAKVVVICKCRT